MTFIVRELCDVRKEQTAGAAADSVIFQRKVTSETERKGFN